MEAEAEILEPYEIHYSDLLLLSSPTSSSPSVEELRRVESISCKVMEALGSSGPGILCVAGVPKASNLRRTLLPLARKLALLKNSDRARILKEHGLGSDVPLKNLDRTVSSFALQLKYPMDPSSSTNLNGLAHELKDDSHMKKLVDMHMASELQNYEFPMLGSIFRDLGLCMMNVGLRLARICDKAIGGKELEESILESCSAKGRLIHYHSILDNHILKNSIQRTKGTNSKTPVTCSSLPLVSEKIANEAVSDTDGKLRCIETSQPQSIKNPKMAGAASCRTSLSNLWQQWHYDYGIFTILTAPIFLSSCNGPTNKVNAQECHSPDGHTYLQLFENTRNKILLVKASPENFIVQLGESADILSKGKLRSTLHSVCRPVSFENISRETFVVFLQPTWGKILHMPEYLTDEEREQQQSTNGEAINGSSIEANELPDSDLLKRDILKSVPPLSSRLRDGMSFAEFSRETTRQYYGGSGIQSRK